MNDTIIRLILYVCIFQLHQWGYPVMTQGNMCVDMSVGLGVIFSLCCVLSSNKQTTKRKENTLKSCIFLSEMAH